MKTVLLNRPFIRNTIQYFCIQSLQWVYWHKVSGYFKYQFIVHTIRRGSCYLFLCLYAFHFLFIVFTNQNTSFFVLVLFSPHLWQLFLQVLIRYDVNGYES